MKHLKYFGDEKNKVLITLSSELMEKQKLIDFNKRLKEHNLKQKDHVININTTFEEMINAISEEIDYRDYDLQEVLEDCKNYCYDDGLIPTRDSWKYSRVQLPGT